MASLEKSSNGPRDGIPCSLCECLKFQDYEPMSTNSDFHSKLFHDSCEDCLQHIPLMDICTFCQHLRIRHLLICLSAWGSENGQYTNLKSLKVELGSIAELRSRQHCQLCRFFCDLITNRYQVWQQTISEEGNPIFLEFSSNGPALRELHGAKKVVRFTVRDIREHYSTPATLSSKVDWGTLHWWKREYISGEPPSHSNAFSSQQTSAPQPPQNFLVIDVDNGCIVSQSRRSRYAALSYVWGDPKEGELQASLANIHDLEEPGALKQAGIPLTILDAMTAASELKIPYLWVDRFCIVQDDLQTKYDLINQMDSIYASALATFVAGAGNDAWYGLPGVSTERSPGQAQTRMQGMELTAVLPTFIDDIMPRMAWNERGWTYQEAMFSENLIFFTDYGVFYERKKSSRKIFAEAPNPRTTSVFSGIKDFFKSVEAYSGRTLRYETDIEKAFSGVLKSFHGEEHAYGSPLRSFDAALRWHTKDGQGKPRQSTDDAVFPSWSWLSVKGRVDFSEAQSTRSSLPVATWAMNVRTANGKSELRFVGTESEEDIEYNSSRVDRAWEAGFFEGERPPHPEKATARDHNSDWSRSSWKSYQSFWFQSRGLQSISVPSQLGWPEKYPLCLRPGHVLVRTQCAHLPKRLKLDYKSEGQSGDGKGLEGMQQSYGSSGELGNGEVIALSFTESFVKVQDHDNLKLERRYKSDRHKRSWRVNVMGIRRVDGVAYRTGLGSVTLKEWKEGKPDFETVVLG